MNAFDGDVFAGNAAIDTRVIIRCDDPLIFIGRADKQAGELEIGSAL